jgi:hypothetical protein
MRFKSCSTLNWFVTLCFLPRGSVIVRVRLYGCHIWLGPHCEGLSVCAAIMRVHFVGSPVDASLVVKSAEFRANSTGKPVTSNVQSVECPTRENLQLNKTEVSPQTLSPTHQIVGKLMIVSRYLP